MPELLVHRIDCSGRRGLPGNTVIESGGSNGAYVRDRLVSAALALISGVTAWMMATRWQWPH